jgi:hypothetical protein
VEESASVTESEKLCESVGPLGSSQKGRVSYLLTVLLLQLFGTGRANGSSGP